MTEDPNSAEQALDLLLYAPVGMVLEFCDRMPELAEKGRERLGDQAPAARLIGEMAVKAGRKKLEEVVTRLREAESAGPETAEPAEPARPAEPTGRGEPSAGYDTMTAAEIIRGLADLSADERAIVKAYELAEKGRRTILGKLEQLDTRERDADG